MPKFIDLTGQRFNRLLVLKRAKTKRKRTIWRCQCDCGNITEVDGSMLRNHNTQSCGCLQIDRTTKHGLLRTEKQTYSTWQHMKDRCYNPNHNKYRHYGGKGITVCEKWRDDFKAFFSDVGPSPGKGYSLDRIDGTKGYEPGNVRWATQKQQNRNREDNNLVTFNGVTKCLHEWSEDLGIESSTLYYRLKIGWPIEKALTAPPDCNRYITYNGETKTLNEWAKSLGITKASLSQRLRRGWSLEKTMTTPK